MQSCRSLQGLARSTLVAGSPTWQRFCLAAAESGQASEAVESGESAAVEQRKRGPYQLTKMLPELDNLGRGRRVKKVHWDEGSFWHIVDAKIAEKKPQEDVASEEIKETLKRISGVKFRNNVPQTGRVCTILDAGKHSWVLLDNS